MIGATAVGDCVERIRCALAAGCDMVLLCNSPEEIPAVLDALQDYSSPPSQLHLMRLRGQQRQQWEALRSSKAWHDARRAIEDLSSAPRFELEG